MKWKPKPTKNESKKCEIDYGCAVDVYTFFVYR